VTLTVFPPTAPNSANLTLSVELAMGIALTFGAWMAHKRSYRVHAWCQSLIVLLNLVVIGVVMVPSFNTTVRPRIPGRLGHSFYTLATTHATFAAIAEAAALYMMLAAGTELLPKQLRPTNLKTGMRITFALWWVALLLGLATYLRWYVPFKRY
jgi:uncharacterized membrane protein YozB (DUF420 family)